LSANERRITTTLSNHCKTDVFNFDLFEKKQNKVYLSFYVGKRETPINLSYRYFKDYFLIYFGNLDKIYLGFNFNNVEVVFSLFSMMSSPPIFQGVYE
jgi:hypothetical protein